MPRKITLPIGRALLAALAMIAAACSSSGAELATDESTPTTSTSSEAEASTDEGDAEGGEVIVDLSTKPVVAIPDGDAPTELVIEDLVEGSGEEAGAGDFLSMQYVGVRFSDGGQFDASWDRGQPFELVLGVGQVIPGWDEGIQGMREGGRRQLTIPPDMAYGERGAGQDIPPDSTLVFVVDLLSTTSPLEVVNAPEPVTELEVEVIAEGGGPEVEAGALVQLVYTAMLQPTGEVFDSSWQTGQAARFVVAASPSQSIPAWDQALVGARVGDHLRMVIPPDLGPGPLGPIGIDDTIITELVILSVGEAPTP